MSLFSTVLQSWYEQNKRDLPWRKTQDPYLIWLSEVILQQTRVQQGLSYFLKFAEHYPNLQAMAAAEEQEILNLWQGLGYYSRARNMHKTARYVTEHCGGVFPEKFEELLKLPGVGVYTASAVSSFAFGEKKAVVDGNVYRVLSRFFNVDEFIDQPKGQKYFQALADEVLDEHNPGRHNQAIMEFGALLCTPKNPDCSLCPLKDQCEAHAQQTVHQLPVKKGKVKVKMRTLHYFVPELNKRLFIRKRGEKDIWANMFEFPLIEGELDPKIVNCVQAEIAIKKHKLTHQDLTVHFYSMTRENLREHFDELIEVELDDLRHYPLPRVIDRFIETYYKQ